MDTKITSMATTTPTPTGVTIDSVTMSVNSVGVKVLLSVREI